MAVQLSGGGKRHHITYTANRQQHHLIHLFTHPSRSLSSMEHKMYIFDTFFDIKKVNGNWAVKIIQSLNEALLWAASESH